jgi:hypothetical protein
MTVIKNLGRHKSWIGYIEIGFSSTLVTEIGRRKSQERRRRLCSCRLVIERRSLDAFLILFVERMLCGLLFDFLHRSLGLRLEAT